MGEWTHATLQQVAVSSARAFSMGPFGSNIRAENYQKNGVPVIRGTNLSEPGGRQFISEGFVYLTEAKADELSSSTAYPNDLIFVAQGTVGKVGIVPTSTPYRRFILSQNTMKVTLNPERADPHFVYYFFRSNLGQHEITSRVNPTGVPCISKPLASLREFGINLPTDIDEQRAIAAILRALDDQIDLNRRMNETLEATARAIFKDWFVDFGPTRAKMEGHAPYHAPEIWSLFPDWLDNEGKPGGWRLTVLQEVLSELETGGRPKGGISGYTFGIPSVGAESIIGLGVFDYSKTKYVPQEFFEGMKKGHIKSRDVLLYKDGGRPGEFEPHMTLFGDGFPFDVCTINEHVYRLRAYPDFGQALLYFWLSSDLAMEEMRIKGTGVAIPGLNSTQVKSLTTLVPTPNIAKAFEAVADPAITRILANCNEARSLAKIRDLLLPKLMSGEIRVKDAEKIAEAAK
jgi:type I restriction enzyme, S subunit